jgi:catechol 2,3-dioxygenase-like lactoylglutathione lyase family enzyme
MKLKRCSITIMVSDLDNSVTFYTETLGLKLSKRYGNHYAEIETPNLLIGLHPSTSIRNGNNISVALGIEDLDASILQLKAKGLELKAERDGKIRLAHFTDPDGNTLYLAEV